MKRIIVQAGHMRPLEPGFEGQTGAPGEARLVARIQQALVGLLESDANFQPVAMPGHIPRGSQCDAAIFLHADGVTDRRAHGFAVGFPAFDVNRKLAHLIAEEIERIPGAPSRRSDNGTTDMSKYYGYSRVETPGPEVLVEHGFVTNPDELEWLTGHVDELARAELNALRRFFGLAPHANGGAAAHGANGHGPVTPDSALRAAPRAPAAAAIRFMRARPHGEYTDGEVESIVNRYYATAGHVGLDPLLVVAQMIEETGSLTSFWSQRPRRNPAGIGVTGEPGVGVQFRNWEQSVRAHTGRLLAYALAPDRRNPAQAALVEEALAFRPLPLSLQGAAATLGGLVGRWAKDPEYATSIARVANEIRGH